MSFTSLVVATDGTLPHDLRVRDAAVSARDRRVPLHIVCSVRPLGRAAADGLPRDVAHTATDGGQREAAMNDIRSLIRMTVPGVELHVTATGLRPVAAERAEAARVGGQVYGIKWERSRRMPSRRARLAI